MKPSTRIREIIQTIDLGETNPFPYALLEYLDEQWEAGACARGEHEFTDIVSNPGGDGIDRLCKNCSSFTLISN